MNIREIKPCPFCGAKAEIDYVLGKGLISCRNPKCNIQPSTWLRVDTDRFSKLVDIWNRREEK